MSSWRYRREHDEDPEYEEYDEDPHETKESQARRMSSFASHTSDEECHVQASSSRYRELSGPITIAGFETAQDSDIETSASAIEASGRRTSNMNPGSEDEEGMKVLASLPRRVNRGLTISDDEPNYSGSVEIRRSVDPTFHGDIKKMPDENDSSIDGIEKDRSNVVDPETWEWFERLFNEATHPSEIDEGLYISNLKTAEAYLDGTHEESWPSIKYVLSTIDYDTNGGDDTEDEPTQELITLRDRSPVIQMNVLRLNIKDSKKINFIDWFPRICAFIQQAIDRRDSPKDGILVHCRIGMSRSVTAVIAYLMWAKHWNDVEAFKIVQNKRPFARPNDQFSHQLKVWHECDCNISPDPENPNKIHEKYAHFLYSEGDILKPAIPGKKANPHNALERAGVQRPPKAEIRRSKRS